MITFQAFFKEKFEYDLHSNLGWLKFLEENEDALDSTNLKELSRWMSHIINVHHIWNTRLMNKISESEDWDLLPLSYFERFLFENYNQTIQFLEQHSLSEKVNYHDSEGVPMEKETMDILYHLLNHSNYHRAQMAIKSKEWGFKIPSSNFIVFR
jgi:uncharacterized damage-inducible protein DinB